jgi:hypothetical protein
METKRFKNLKDLLHSLHDRFIQELKAFQDQVPLVAFKGFVNIYITLSDPLEEYPSIYLLVSKSLFWKENWFFTNDNYLCKHYTIAHSVHSTKLNEG